MVQTLVLSYFVNGLVYIEHHIFNTLIIVVHILTLEQNKQILKKQTMEDIWFLGFKYDNAKRYVIRTAKGRIRITKQAH